MLLKSFQLDGCFPATPHEVPASVVAFLAQQLALDPLAFGHYDWWGRVIDDHRRLIRQTLGVRAWMNTLAAYDGMFCARISARLSAATAQHLDALLTTIEPAHPDAQAPDPAASRRALFDILKSDPGPLTVETAKEEVFKLLHVRALGLPSALFADVLPRTADASLASNDAPLASNDARLASNDAPLASNDEPTASNDEPTASNEASLASNDEPTAFNDPRLASNDASLASNDAPLASNDARLGSNNQPTASNDARLACMPAPLEANDERVSYCQRRGLVIFRVGGSHLQNSRCRVEYTFV